MKRLLPLLAGLIFPLIILAQTPEKISAQYATETNILYRDKMKEKLTSYADSQCRLDIYYPKDSKKFITVVWFHGGGLYAGTRYLPEQLKEKNIAVVSVSYRLHPRVKSPVYIEDAAAAIAWVFANIEKYGGDPDKIVVSGHSAGGYLTMMTGLDKKWLLVYGIDANKIAMLIPFSGQTVTHFTIRKERNIPEKQTIVDEYAPLFHCRADAPPLVLITGDREKEIFGRYEENAYMMRMMKENGHKETYLYELGGYNHGDMAAPAFHILLDHIRKFQE